MPCRRSQNPCSRGEREWVTGQPAMPASRVLPVRTGIGVGAMLSGMGSGLIARCRPEINPVLRAGSFDGASVGVMVGQ